MFDPFGSMQNFMGRFQNFAQNPMQFLMQQKMNIPQEYANDPQNAIQYLVNNGKVTQEQVNQARRMWENPQTKQQIQQMFNNQK